MLEINNLSVAYGNVVAVADLSVAATPGRITLILGTNGAGKTTSLSAVSGLLSPRSGMVAVDGRNITGLAPHRVVREGVVMVPEGRRVFSRLSVEENLLIGGYKASARERREKLAESYGMFPILRERKELAAGLLSGGEQQMLAFGRALMSSPKYVMMDEPSMGLAPILVEQVLESARKIADAGAGVLMVEQNAEAGLAVADDVVIMSRGTIIFRGDARDARTNASVMRAFLGDAALDEDV
jgi:branched-chain amino acid transport system ATP-binding protein